jgi:hypothetical protein
MGEVIRFIKKSERERDCLIREARAMYDSVFPPADPVSEQRDKAPAAHTVSGAHSYRSDGVPPASPSSWRARPRISSPAPRSTAGIRCRGEGAIPAISGTLPAP